MTDILARINSKKVGNIIFRDCVPYIIERYGYAAKGLMPCKVCGNWPEVTQLKDRRFAIIHCYRCKNGIQFITQSSNFAELVKEWNHGFAMSTYGGTQDSKLQKILDIVRETCEDCDVKSCPACAISKINNVIVGIHVDHDPLLLATEDCDETGVTWRYDPEADTDVLQEILEQRSLEQM